MRRGAPESWRLCFTILALGALLGVTGMARANGRFPLAQRLYQDPAMPERMLLANTFGLLTTEDAGANWDYVCERAFALEVVEADALLEVLPNGVILSGLISSLTRSSDGACSFEAVLGLDPLEGVPDLTKAPDGSVLAIVRKATSPTEFRLEQSADGTSWETVSALPGEVVEALTLDVAPSAANRIYVSVLTNTPDGALLVSDDGGKNWETRSITGADFAEQPYIAAVHPTNPDALFVRTDGWDLNGDLLEEGDDALLYSDDGGVSWREVLRRGAKLFGFALSPDASTVLAGYGDPVQAVRVTRTEDLGIYRASTADFDFSQVVSAPIGCLLWNDQGVFACLGEGHPELGTDFSLGFAPDANFASADATAFSPRLVLSQVRGPLACTSELCLSDWLEGSDEIPATCARLGTDCGMGGAPGGGGATAGSPAGRAGSESGDAGDGPVGAGAGGVAAGGAQSATEPEAGRPGSDPPAGGSGAGGEPDNADTAAGCGCGISTGPGLGLCLLCGLLAFAVGSRRFGVQLSRSRRN